MDYTAVRQNMIERQLRTGGIVDDAVLASMAAVPRERFVSERLQSVAYIDEDLELSAARCLMAPCVLARLLQEARIEPSDVALDIGSGTGYAAAVMAGLATTVFSLESTPELAARAAELAAELGLDNVVPVDGNLAGGCAEYAPYNVILFEGSIDAIPQTIVDQLADGGRLAAIVRENGLGRGTIVSKSGGNDSRRWFFEATVPALPEFLSGERFEF